MGPDFELEQGFKCQVNLFHFYGVAHREALMGFKEKRSTSCVSGHSEADRDRARGWGHGESLGRVCDGPDKK